MPKLYLPCGNCTCEKKWFRKPRPWTSTAATSAFDPGEWLYLGDQPRPPLGKNWSERVPTLRENSYLNCSRRIAAGLRRILTTCPVCLRHSKLISPNLLVSGVFMRCSAEKTFPMLERACFGATQVCFFW